MNVKKIFDHRRLHTKQSFTIISLLLTTLLLFSSLILLFNSVSPFASASEDDNDVPLVESGRVLSSRLTGDTSDWVEIAKYGDEYSLIVRKNYITHYPGSGDPKWQYTGYGGYDGRYYYNRPEISFLRSSNVRDRVNNWFNNSFSNGVDGLLTSARLRSYTMENTAIANLGTSSTSEGLSNGFSNPTSVKASMGEDVAFALSYSEAAAFLSKTYDVYGMNPENQNSNSVAISNFNKMSIPLPQPDSSETPVYSYGMWLRSRGSSFNGDDFTVAGVLDYYTDTIKY